jgi:hypothetical protein
MKPKEFNITVNDPIASEYIQKLAFASGVKWLSGASEIKNTGLDNITFNGYALCINEDSNYPTYKFPEQASEIVKLFEKEKQPEFKEGDYIWLNYCRCVFKINDNPNQSKYSHDLVRLATPSEIEKFLIEEAKQKGFVVGAKVRVARRLDNAWLLNHDNSLDSIVAIYGDTGKIRRVEVFNNQVFLELDCHSYGRVLMEALDLLPKTPVDKIKEYEVKYLAESIKVGCTEVMVKDIHAISEYYKSK